MAGKVKRDMGGDRLLVKSGGTIEVASGGILSVNGTDVSAGLEEIANLNGLSAAEVAFIDGAVSGTPAAGKALITDAGQVTVINYLDGSVAGTPAENKVLVTDAGQVSLFTALEGAPLAATISVAAEGTNAIVATVQLNKIDGTALAQRGVVGFFLSSDEAGDVPVDSTVDDVVPTATGDGAFIDSPLTTTQLGFSMISESDGDIEITFTNAGDDNITRYVHCVGPLGTILDTETLAFTTD